MLEETARHITEHCWVVVLCDIAKLHNQADYVITMKAKEALFVHKGCEKCMIYCPDDRLSFEDSL